MSRYFEDSMIKKLKKIFRQLDLIQFQLEEIMKENKNMSVQMDELVSAVAAEDTVIDGVILTLGTFNARLADINTELANVKAALDLANVNTADLAAVNAKAVELHTDVESKTTALAAAVAEVPAP